MNYQIIARTNDSSSIISSNFQSIIELYGLDYWDFYSALIDVKGIIYFRLVTCGLVRFLMLFSIKNYVEYSLRLPPITPWSDFSAVTSAYPLIDHSLMESDPRLTRYL